MDQLATSLPKAAARARGWRYWLPRLAVALLTPVLLLAVTEAVLRICGVGHPTGATRPCTDQGRAAVCDNQFFAAAFFPPGMLRTPRPYVIPEEKAPGAIRIFILGESAAWGDPDPTYGFGRYFEVMLRERYPGVQFEVINTSITAINSHVLVPMTRDLARRKPDIFIIYAGNNEVVGPFGPGTVLTSSGMKLGTIRARVLVNSTRFSQLITRTARAGRQPQWRGMEMFLDRQVRRDAPAMQSVYENFAANLHNMIAAAKASGARVLLSTVATNLKDCPPFASTHRTGLSQDDLRAWGELVQRGAVLESAGSYKEALDAYRVASRIDAQYAELEFRIARCLEMLNEPDAAKQHYIQAQDLDTLRFRTDSKLNDTIRSAAKTNGVELVDAAAIFAQESTGGMPGNNLFYEHVHMNPHGNYVLARALLRQVESSLPDGVQRANGEVASEEEFNRRLALTRFDRARLAGLVASKLAQPPFTNQLDHEAQLLKMKMEATPPDLSFDETAAEYQWAIAQNPQDRLLHLNYGFFLYQFDRKAADQEFRAALPYDNAPVLCNWRKFN